MLTNTTSMVALIVIATGILFQLLISARVGARYAYWRLKRHQERLKPPVAPNASPALVPALNRVRHPYRDYRAALRAAGHRAERIV
jgi:hypothetical protein